jgi:hypothetical protein
MLLADIRQIQNQKGELLDPGGCHPTRRPRQPLPQSFPFELPT